MPHKTLQETIREIQHLPNLSTEEKAIRIQEAFAGFRGGGSGVAKPSTTEEERPICPHYRRECDIISACCQRRFGCRLCHDDEVIDHKINRFNTMRVVCRRCSTEQDVGDRCVSCDISFGEYYCAICRLWMEDGGSGEGCGVGGGVGGSGSGGQFHCNSCGICIRSKKEDTYHCDACGLCYVGAQRLEHKCASTAMGERFREACAVCQESMWQSVKERTTLRCGHVIHTPCLQEHIRTGAYRCPLCKKSLVDMDWGAIEELVASQPMPEEYAGQEVEVHCNDCLQKSVVAFHFVGMKCGHCGGYNTSR